MGESLDDAGYECVSVRKNAGELFWRTVRPIGRKLNPAFSLEIQSASENGRGHASFLTAGSAVGSSTARSGGFLLFPNCHNSDSSS
jgi:hypothetical protein